MAEPKMANADIRILRDAKASDIVSTFARLTEVLSASDLCRGLLAAVRKETLRPGIFSIFLSWSKSADVIARCLQQEDTSTYVRRLGIKHLGRALADHRRWETTWEAVGSVQGVVNLFSRFSVTDVKTLTVAIGRCNRGQVKVEEREAAIEGLLQAMLPSHYPGPSITNSDKRPLQEHFARMVTACSPEFVAKLLDDRDDSNPLFRELPTSLLFHTHWKLLRSRVDEGLHGQTSRVHDVREYLVPLLYSFPPLPGTEPKTTESMQFSLKVLQERLKDPEGKSRPRVSEAAIVISLLSRSIRKKRGESKIYDLLKLSLEVLEVKPETKSMFDRSGLWTTITSRWGRIPKLYEDLLIRAFELRLSGPENTIGSQCLQMQRNLKLTPERSWDLLRLYCLHVPKKPFDIDDIDGFRSSKGQTWPIALFYDLNKDNAIKLLKGLLLVQPNINWLDTQYRGSSILTLSSVGEQHNINAISLLIHLQNGNEEALTRAQGAVVEFKKKSAIAREQTDRALFAKTAAFFAIASGSLELYADVVKWQQRFVRDPLTIKTIFAENAVNTIEGHNLLSGILYDNTDDVTEGVEWTDIESTVEEANGILMNFQEAHRVAKAEPSYHSGDWQAIPSLFRQAINTRTERAKILQEKLKALDADVYASVWYKTLQMLGKVEKWILESAQRSVSTLLKTLPPELLSTTAETLLELDNKKRATKARDDQDHVMERLSYEALQHLAESDKPQLASDLILKTILERPDASSWHRYLLSIGFLKRLPAKSAEEMFLSFASAIGEKLEEQSYIKVGEKSTGAPLIKVTTVKYVAQVLDNAQFISADATVDVLTELFKSGTHRDIRIATLESMLSMLNKLCSGTEESWSNNPLVERLLTAMESVIPVIGSINEGRPPREQDWQEAKETGKLPEIFDHVGDLLPPLLQIIMDATASGQYPALAKFRSRFVERILLPALNRSQDEHRRWLALFVEKHKAPILMDNLPLIPFMPVQIRTMISRFHELIPGNLLERHHRFVFFNLARPASLDRFNARLRNEEELQNTRAVKHWLAIFGQDVGSTIQAETMTLIDLIHSDWKPSKVANGVTVEQIENKIVDQVSRVLDHYDENIAAWDKAGGFGASVAILKLVNRLRQPSHRSHSKSAMDGWTQSCKPVLQRITHLIKVKRTPEWQQDPHRQPLDLPSTNTLSFWLLPYPTAAVVDRKNLEQQCAVFAHEAREIIVALLDESPEEVLDITQQALTISASLTDEERIRVALALVDNKSPQMKAVVHVVLADVASQLLKDGEKVLGKGGELRMRVRGLLETWLRSEIGKIRRRAVELKVEKGGLWERVFED